MLGFIVGFIYAWVSEMLKKDGVSNVSKNLWF